MCLPSIKSNEVYKQTGEYYIQLIYVKIILLNNYLIYVFATFSHWLLSVVIPILWTIISNKTWIYSLNYSFSVNISINKYLRFIIYRKLNTFQVSGLPETRKIRFRPLIYTDFRGQHYSTTLKYFPLWINERNKQVGSGSSVCRGQDDAVGCACRCYTSRCVTKLNEAHQYVRQKVLAFIIL